MKIITRQDLANGAADRWRNQYQRPSGDMRRDFQGGYAALLALGPTPKPEAVNAAVGNDSWTRLTCSACQKEVARVVAIDVTSGEYATHLCADCVIQMADLFAVTK